MAQPIRWQASSPPSARRHHWDLGYGSSTSSTSMSHSSTPTTASPSGCAAAQRSDKPSCYRSARPWVTGRLPAADDHSRDLLLPAQALNGLACDLGYYLKVLVEVQDREPGQFGGRGDDQVRYGGGAVLAAVGEQGKDLYRPLLDRGGQVFDRHGRQGGLPPSGPQLGARSG